MEIWQRIDITWIFLEQMHSATHLISLWAKQAILGRLQIFSVPEKSVHFTKQITNKPKQQRWIVSQSYKTQDSCQIRLDQKKNPSVGSQGTSMRYCIQFSKIMEIAVRGNYPQDYISLIELVISEVTVSAYAILSE